MLSKSKFILGQQCAKSFWLDLNNVPPTNEEDDAAKDRLRAGDEVGEIAKDIFPGGKEVPYLIGNHKEMFEITKDLIKEGTTVGLANGILKADEKKIYSADILIVGLFK